MTTRIRNLVLPVALLAGSAFRANANNLGNILSLRLLTGKDSLRYIEITHSDRDLQDEGAMDFRGWTSPFQYHEVYIRKPEDEPIFLAIWSILQQAQACQCIQLYAINGAYMPGVVDGNNQPVRIDEYRFTYRW